MLKANGLHHYSGLQTTTFLNTYSYNRKTRVNAEQCQYFLKRGQTRIDIFKLAAQERRHTRIGLIYLLFILNSQLLLLLSFMIWYIRTALDFLPVSDMKTHIHTAPSARTWKRRRFLQYKHVIIFTILDTIYYICRTFTTFWLVLLRGFPFRSSFLLIFSNTMAQDS